MYNAATVQALQRAARHLIARSATGEAQETEGEEEASDSRRGSTVEAAGVHARPAALRMVVLQNGLCRIVYIMYCTLCY